MVWVLRGMTDSMGPRTMDGLTGAMPPDGWRRIREGENPDLFAYIPGSWGVTIKLTAMSDYIVLRRALRRHGRTRPKFSGKYMVRLCPVCHQRRRFYGRDSEDGWGQVCRICGHIRGSDYTNARGILPRQEGDPLPEELIRKMRDEWNSKAEEE